MRPGSGFAVICAVVVLWPMTEAHAQKMYRCGSAYQDRPCEGAQAGKEMRNFAGASTTPTRSVADAQCAYLGEESMKVLANRPGDHWLIETVYLKRGTALEVRAAIEATCMADKERQAASQAAAAARIQGTANVPPPSTQGPSPDDMARFQERRDAEIAANQEAYKKSRCADLKRQYDSLAQQERVGGSSAAMQHLRDRRRSLDERRSSEGC
jgi:hypothetical protein